MVGHVGDADVEEGQVGLDDVADEDLELGLEVGALHALLQLGHHPGVHLAGHQLLDLFQGSNREIARARADLEDHVRGSRRKVIDGESVVSKSVNRLLLEIKDCDRIVSKSVKNKQI